MAGSNNFLQFNEEKNNMLNDGDYAANSTRTDGFVQGKASSILFNKLMYQLTTFVSAFGEALKSKDYVVSDASLTTLTAILEKVITQKDLDDSYYDSIETDAAITSAVAGVAVPVGAVLPLATDVVPTGYLKCNGLAVSRTIYSALFALIGTTYGVGDGGTTFNLPDYRGMFFRGWNNSRTDSFKDPDVASRAAGDAVGSTQLNENKSHLHTVPNVPNSGGATGVYDVGSGTATGTFNTGLSGGSESRPNNIYVMYVIKY